MKEKRTKMNLIHLIFLFLGIIMFPK